MTECAGHDNVNCRKDLSERMDNGFIKKPGVVGRWVIGAICSVAFLIAASMLGFAVHYVQAQGERVYKIDKTQAKIAQGFENLSDALKKITEVTEKLNESTVRNQERIDAATKEREKLERRFEKKLNGLDK